MFLLPAIVAMRMQNYFALIPANVILITLVYVSYTGMIKNRFSITQLQCLYMKLVGLFNSVNS